MRFPLQSMMRSWVLVAVLVVALAGLASAPVLSQLPRAPIMTPALPLVKTQTADPKQGPEATRVEADVATRSVAITSSFTGVEIVVFGAIDNAKTRGPEAGLYDVVLVVAGEPQKTTVRQKSRRVGIWINTKAVIFEKVPSYYAIASTRPLDELASDDVLNKNRIGFESIPMQSVTDTGAPVSLTPEMQAQFREAVIRLKDRDRLFQKDDYGVVFVGRNLFRATIDLPANVPVGPLQARIFLLRDGTLIDTFETVVKLERSGLERYLHAFAFGRPLLYGIFCVLVAVLAGLAASAIVQRMRRA